MKHLLLISYLLLQAPAAPQVRPGPIHYVPGKVIVEGAHRPLPKVYVDVVSGTNRTALGEDGRRIRGSGTFGATAVGRDGTFRLFLQDGEYTVLLITSLGMPLSAEDGYYVKSMSSGSADLLQQKLQVRNGTAPLIAITLAAGQQPAPTSRN